MSRSHLLSSGLLLLIACGGSADGRAQRDAIELTPHLALDLPMADADSVVAVDLRDAIRRPDGALVLLDADQAALVFLDSTGRVTDRRGRHGSGPGEFEYPDELHRCTADSLFVWDPNARVIHVLDAQGRYARRFRITTAMPQKLTCTGRGVLAVFSTSAFPRSAMKPGADQPTYRGPLVILSSEGDSLAAVDDLPLGQNRWMGGLAVLGASDSTIVVGVSSSPVLRQFTFDGTAVGADTLPIPDRPVSDSLYDAELDRASGTTGAEGALRDRIRAMLAVVPKPDLAPYYQQLQVTPNGTSWLVTSLPTDPVTDVAGRLPDGHDLRFSLPRHVEVFEIGTDYLLGKAIGEDGEDHLLLYRWERP